MDANNLIGSYKVLIPSLIVGGSFVYFGLTNIFEINDYNNKLKNNSSSNYKLLSKEVARLDSLINNNSKKIEEYPDSASMFKNEVYSFYDNKTNIITSKEYLDGKKESEKPSEKQSKDWYLLIAMLGAVPLSVGMSGALGKMGILR